MLAPDPSIWYTSIDSFDSEDSVGDSASFVSQEEVPEEIEVPEAPVPPTPFPWALLLINLICFRLGMTLPFISMESLLSFANSFWFWSGPLSWIVAGAHLNSPLFHFAG